MLVRSSMTVTAAVPRPRHPGLRRLSQVERRVELRGREQAHADPPARRPSPSALPDPAAWTSISSRQ